MYLTHSPSVATTGLIMCYDAANPRSYAGSGTTINDMSGGSVNGTLTNGPTYNSANLGSISFDGIDDFILTNTNFPTLSTEWTVDCWCKPGTSQVTYADIWGNHGGGAPNGFVMQQNVNTLNQYYVAFGNGSTYFVTSNIGVTASVWNHVVAVKNSASIIAYINGVVVTNDSLVGTMAASPQNFMVASGVSGGGRNWNGSVASIKVYNRALSAAEVTQNFNALQGRYGI